jgi:hypothetical protein
MGETSRLRELACQRSGRGWLKHPLTCQTKTILRFVAASFILLGGVASPVYAWNNFGHMSVGYVAYQKLTPQTRDQANALLRKNPDFPNWEAMIPVGTSDANKDMMIFMIAATWADRIKGSSSFSDEDPSTPDKPDGATSFQNIGFTDHFRHRYWHFVDVAFTQDGTASLPPTPVPNAKERIEMFRLVLGGSDDDLKSYDLSWLLHLVGDVHQPLHCATRVGQSQTDGDHGGNLVEVVLPEKTTKLHGFWDDVLGTNDVALKAVMKSARKLPKADATQASDLKVDDWIDEGVQNAKDAVYVHPIGLGSGPFKTTSAYRRAAKSLAKKRVALAGERLANLLNAELK